MYAEYARTPRPEPVKKMAPPALGEWLFTGALRDNACPSGDCDLCGKDDARFQFGVRNRMTGAGRLACLACVSRRDVTVADGATVLPEKDKKRFLREAVARIQCQTCKALILQLRASSQDALVDECLLYYSRNYELSPQCASVLFHLLEENGIAFEPSIFCIQTRSAAHKVEFGELGEAAKRSVWPALTLGQKLRLASLGFAPTDASVN